MHITTSYRSLNNALAILESRDGEFHLVLDTLYENGGNEKPVIDALGARIAEQLLTATGYGQWDMPTLIVDLHCRVHMAAELVDLLETANSLAVA